MAGISSVLNIAKEALLAHQLSVQVASHNVANVDTPGYTRQTLSLTPNQATPLSVGNIGNGVHGDMITRQYDQFMTQRIMNQNSTLGNLEAQQQALRTVETIFNEAPGLALNDLMSQFWDSWQKLSDNPEIVATRQLTVQQGQLLFDQFQHMNSEITQGRYDIGVNLDTAIGDVNSLTAEIAKLNVEISNSESENRKANDLRDQRDLLVKDLSDMLDINYFESSTGSYTVLLADGHSLVDTNQSWQVNWKDNQLNWLSTGKDGAPVSTPLGDGLELGGKIGGWLEIRGELLEGDPNNYLGRLDALANAMIREVNQLHSQGVGLVPFGESFSGTEVANNTASLTSTVDASTAHMTIAAGTFEINGREIGRIEGVNDLNGLAMGKAYSAKEAINDAVTGATAKLTTLVAGDAVTGLGAGESVSFTVNGISVTHTAVGAETAAQTAASVVAQITAEIAAYNATPPPIKMSIEAVVGDDTNGGVANSIVLRNTVDGDESRIVIGDVDNTDPAESKLGLTDGTYTPDETHNTGEITLFSSATITIRGGTNDLNLDQLGLGSAMSGLIGETSGDGLLVYDPNEQGSIGASLQGFEYADELQLDGNSFGIWLYDNNGTALVPQAVTVDIERATTLYDVASAINNAVNTASSPQSGWLKATVEQNKLRLTPDSSHQFSFTSDSTNFLQVAGINTFLTGHNAGTFGINSLVAENLDHVAAGKVSATGTIYRGDNSNAIDIGNIQQSEYVRFTGGSTNTLDDFYNALVADIGSQGRSVDRNVEYSTLVYNQMNQLRDETSGVSLDEEMANLIKFQHAYSAAAKLISASDEMLQTLLRSVGI